MTYYGSAKLVADDLADFDMTIANGFAVDNLDLGFPTIRGVSTLNPDYDGEDDQTSFYGARAVVLSGTIVPTDSLSRQAVLDRLAEYLHPARRPHIVYELEPGSGVRRMRLRADQHARPISRPGFALVSAGWRAPDGFQESDDVDELLLHGWHEDEEGRMYPLDFDRVFPESPVMGLGELEIGGNIGAGPIITIEGPCGTPRIENVTTGRQMKFDVDLAAGESLTIDVTRRTVTDQAGSPRTNTRDPLYSTWWTLQPGVNLVRYYPLEVDVGTTATIRARARWI